MTEALIAARLKPVYPRYLDWCEKHGLYPVSESQWVKLGVFTEEYMAKLPKPQRRKKAK